MIKVTEIDLSRFTPTPGSLTFSCAPNGPVRLQRFVVNEPEDVDDAMEVPRGTTRAMAESIKEYCDRLGIPPKRRRRRSNNKGRIKQ